MPVNLQSTPITNSCNVRIAFLNAGAIVKSLDPGDADVLTITFDQIGLYNPGHMPVIRTQNPNVAYAVTPGEVAFVDTGNNQTLLHHAPPHGQEQTVRFT